MIEKYSRKCVSLMLAFALLSASLPAGAEMAYAEPEGGAAPAAEVTDTATGAVPATEAAPGAEATADAETAPAAKTAPVPGVMPATGAAAAPGTAAEPETRQLMAVVKYTSFGRINMRADPDESSARVGVLSGGTLVKVLQKSVGRWVLVEGEGKTGYMSTNFLELFYEGETPPIPVKPEAPATKKVNPPAPSGNSSYYAPSEPVTVLSWPVVESTILYVDTPNGKGLNLRAGPSKSYAAIGSYRVGTRVIALARRGEWAYVSVGDRTGFMMRTYLSYDMPGPVPPAPEPTPIATVTVVHPWGSFVNLRSSTTTDTNKNILARIPHGTEVELLEWGFWYSLIRYDGITGYIVSRYLKYDD